MDIPPHSPTERTSSNDGDVEMKETKQLSVAEQVKQKALKLRDDYGQLSMNHFLQLAENSDPKDPQQVSKCAEVQQLFKEETEKYNRLRGALLSALHDFGITDIFPKESEVSKSSQSEKDSTLQAAARVTMPQHHTLLASLLKVKVLPIKPGTTDGIDYEKVILPTDIISKAPKFKIEINANEQDLAITLVDQVYRFFENFKKYYDDALTAEHFEPLAYRLMTHSLLESSSVGDLELRRTFEEQINFNSKYASKSWIMVQLCLADQLRVTELKADVNSALMTLHKRSAEDVDMFVQRVRRMIRVSGNETFELRLLRVLFSDLPQQGREKVLDKFTTLEDLIKLAEGQQKDPVELYLDFISSTKTVYQGEPCDNTDWHVQRFQSVKASPPTNYPAVVPTTTTVQHSFVHGNKGGPTKVSPGRTDVRHQPYSAAKHKFKGSPPMTSAIASPGKQCVEPLCVSTNGRHYADQCWKVTQPAKFAAKQARFDSKQQSNQPRPYQPRPNPPKVAAMVLRPDLKAQKRVRPGPKMVAAVRPIQSPAAPTKYPEIQIPLLEACDNGEGGDREMAQLTHEVNSLQFQISNPHEVAQSYRETMSPLQVSPLLSSATLRIAALKDEGPDMIDNRIFAAMTLDGRTVKALIDTGSMISVIHRDIADEMKLKYQSVPGSKTQLAAAGLEVDSLRTVNKIRLKMNKRTSLAHLYVMDLDGCQALIGMDLLFRHGYRLEGQECFQFSPSEEYPLEDLQPLLIPDEVLEEEKTEEFQAARQKMLDELEPLLAQNEAIDPTSHCTLPMMKVRLKVKKGAHIYQYVRKWHAHSQKGLIDDTVNKWIADKVIEESPPGCAYNNNLTLAARRTMDGTVIKYRVCLDPRELNNNLEEIDRFPLPLITDIIDKAAGHKYFTTIDLSQAYHRMPIDEESRKYTAFTYEGKQYVFAKAPFGLSPLVSHFQRGITKILGGLVHCSPYLDDCFIYGDTIEECQEQSAEVIKRLTAAGLIINRSKCNFLRSRISLLGFIIDRNGKSLDKNKLANIHTWAPPTNGKMIQRYLGMFNFFREFIPCYSTLTAPLDRLRNVKYSFTLNKLEQSCFDSLKELLQNAPILCFPDFHLPFYVATDASNLGLGAVLYQLVKNDKGETEVRYISFVARSLSQSERRYAAYKKELAGIIFALNKFHYYIYGRRFTLFTDHRPLTYIHEQKELPRVLDQWKEIIFKYDFQCVYRPGILNIIPDALSRAFPADLWDITTDGSGERLEGTSTVSAKIAAITRRSKTSSEAPSENTTDNEPEEIISSEDLAKSLNTDARDPDLLQKDDHLSQTDKLLVFEHLIRNTDDELISPHLKKERDELMAKIHEFGHPGSNEMVKQLQLKGYKWPQMKQDCLQWVRKCSPCQHYNISRRGFQPMQAVHAHLPGEHLQIDLAQLPTSEKGNNYVLLVVDICTRFVFLRALVDKSAVSIANALFSLFCDIGFPKIIQSDNGTEFVNYLMQIITNDLQVDHRLSTPYHPRTNGAVERQVSNLKSHIQKAIEGNPGKWDTYLSMTQLQMNTRTASLHGSTPFSLFFGRPFAGIEDFSDAEPRPMTEAELLKRMTYLSELVFPGISDKAKKTQKRMVDKFNAKNRLADYPNGSWVMVVDQKASSSLDPKYEGPFKVVNRTSRGAYILQDLTDEVLPRNYSSDQLKLVTQDLAEEGKRFEIESILDDQFDQELQEQTYLVKWKGYDDNENLWIPYENFDSKAIVNTYYKRRNKLNPHSAKRPAEDPIDQAVRQDAAKVTHKRGRRSKH